MNALQFEILADAYEISADGQVLARLPRGPLAILGGAGERLRDLDIEIAIEHAEDWLMPSSKSFQGFALVVKDTQGRLRDRLGAGSRLTPDDVEIAFTRAFDDVAFARPIDRLLVADMVLLRELVHHGAAPHVEVLYAKG
jgi:hypothetical protein